MLPRAAHPAKRDKHVSGRCRAARFTHDVIPAWEDMPEEIKPSSPRDGGLRRASWSTPSITSAGWSTPSRIKRFLEDTLIYYIIGDDALYRSLLARCLQRDGQLERDGQARIRPSP